MIADEVRLQLGQPLLCRALARTLQQLEHQRPCSTNSFLKPNKYIIYHSPLLSVKNSQLLSLNFQPLEAF